jgi:hypothetical protein
MYSSHTIDSVTCLRLSSRPIRLGLPAIAPPGTETDAPTSEQTSLQHRVGDVIGQRPTQPRRLEALDRQPHRRGAVPIRRAISRIGIPADFNLITSRTWRIASLSIGIQVPLRKAESGTVSEPEEASSPRATSSQNGGRDHLGMVGEIIPEQWATSSGISSFSPIF